jgi:hypothetical protein
LKKVKKDHQELTEEEVETSIIKEDTEVEEVEAINKITSKPKLEHINHEEELEEVAIKKEVVTNKKEVAIEESLIIRETSKMITIDLIDMRRDNMLQEKKTKIRNQISRKILQQEDLKL